jgi:chromate transporter
LCERTQNGPTRFWDSLRRRRHLGRPPLRIIPRLRRSAVAGAFLDGVNVASLALMAAVSLRLGRAAVIDLPTALIALASLVLLVRFRVSSTWLILGGSDRGLFLTARG